MDSINIINENSKKICYETLTILNEQGDTLNNTHKKIDNINENINISSKLINNMKCVSNRVMNYIYSNTNTNLNLDTNTKLNLNLDTNTNLNLDTNTNLNLDLDSDIKIHQDYCIDKKINYTDEQSTILKQLIELKNLNIIINSELSNHNDILDQIHNQNDNLSKNIKSINNKLL